MATVLLRKSLRTHKACIALIRPTTNIICGQWYHKYRKKKPRDAKVLNIKELLEEGEANEKVTESEANPKPAINTEWAHSENRFNSLKTAEKRVAVMAVIVMLLGYVGIKWMVSAYPSSGQINDEAIKGEPTSEANQATDNKK
ncbi:uncharacterized protein LOC116619162 [Nematostella vectensis]|uniref:uncharacterized protein LOC116619162 n=1 Tax=Nematostella vectensis TaxID=45351 RepID=UPI0020777D16|nr:uncharacterized protein LOC116619162 [Nematostella vectensis]